MPDIPLSNSLDSVYELKVYTKILQSAFSCKVVVIILYFIEIFLIRIALSVVVDYYILQNSYMV